MEVYIYGCTKVIGKETFVERFVLFDNFSPLRINQSHVTLYCGWGVSEIPLFLVQFNWYVKVCERVYVSSPCRTCGAFSP